MKDAAFAAIDPLLKFETNLDLIRQLQMGKAVLLIFGSYSFRFVDLRPGVLVLLHENIIKSQSTTTWISTSSILQADTG